MTAPLHAPRHANRTFRLGAPGGALVVALVALLPACQPKIGDACKTARDCSIRGERQCDLSNAPQNKGGEFGECTIENCSFGSCPDEAICVKTYGSDFLTVACDPDREDIWTSCERGGDDPNCICDETNGAGDPIEEPGCDGQRVPLDDCLPNETCLPEGLCADEISARTSCRLECDSSSDCRKPYQCKRIGTNGIYVSPRPKNPTGVPTAKICVPR